eukprot:CAMPEP_0201719916 /NCGR_PEP_ID=MMETSP0593-20130828/4975_1 /ASSEMBLY_ACC=CAM_ASM_000672 /TAXON_ID=267983 /ORGANISM="Skeletonema japonicum, Strain CCMP2506" /LENGTH=472 /DNA_ID=CAMNT_0048210435 /DNA_START=27 /DNA_END=1445 /DNA_ORIENTATION=-
MRLLALVSLINTAVPSLAGGTHSHGDDGFHVHENEHDMQQGAVDCTTNFCKTQLSTDLEKRWHIHMPSDYDPNDDMCAQCEITVQLIYDGYTWLGYGVSPDGGMVGATVVIGRPSEEQPTVYELEGKMKMRVRPVTGFNLENASIKYDNENAQTIMEFTTPFNTFGVTEEDDEYRVGISLSSPTYFIYAHGNEGNIELDYHGGKNKGSRMLENLINPDAALLADDDEASASAMTMVQTKSTKKAWMAHGILAFLAWGVCAPMAISAAVLRDLDWNIIPFKNFLAKFWLYTHAGLNCLNYIFTVAAFSVAVKTSSTEMHDHFDHTHPRMGLSIFILVSFQVLGGLLRPSKKVKSTLRKTWENVHHLLGVALFCMGVYQLYSGLSMYRERYSEVSSVLYVVLGLMVFLWAFIILGGSLYKLVLHVRGGEKEKITELTKEPDNKDGERTSGDINDLNFKEEDFVENGEPNENEVI